MEQTFITKIAMIVMIVVVFMLLIGFYGQFQKLLDKDREIQKNRDDKIQQVFEKANAKLISVIILGFDES